MKYIIILLLLCTVVSAQDFPKMMWEHNANWYVRPVAFYGINNYFKAQTIEYGIYASATYHSFTLLDKRFGKRTFAEAGTGFLFDVGSMVILDITWKQLKKIF